MMATHGGITDDLLARLAEDIETDEQMEALGRSLGVSHPAIRRYTETSRLEGRVTCRGTRDMLFDWRQTVVPTDQHPRLKQALIDAHLVMLAETHLEGASSSPDIFGKKISESLTVGQCRDKLRHRYLDKLCKIQLKPWDKSNYAELKDLHTVVTMMRKDSSGKDTKNKEELEGSVDKIFSTKVNGRLPSRILISAPAGVGKTTAVAKIAYDWAERKKESALEHLPLLFVVKFRNTSHRTSIGESIKSQLLSDVDDLTPEGIESFIRRNQRICHIILDGLDEYAGISSQNNIVSVIRSDEFPQCRVLVTTRPHLESYFNQDDLPWVYTKMWIEGFSMESSREYIDRFFTLNLSEEKGKQLKEYLNDQPLIDELVKTPLFCLMICHLWSKDQLRSDVSTQTHLFDSVNEFLMHHANARSRSTTSRLTFTHRNLSRIVKELGRIALYGILDDAKKLIFTLRDFRKVPHILDKACELGIVSKTTVPISNLPQSDETTSTQIEFYHKLAQEHSAGKFIASITWRILFWLRVSKLDRILWKINSNIGDYEHLIRFAAGTDRHLGIRIMEALLSNEHLEENERYRILLDCSSESKDSRGNMSSMVQRCVTAQSIILKSPTMYTVVGLEKLPKQLQREVRTMRFVESVLTADVTRRMWSCLKLFPSLNTINITDSSLSFPSSLPKLSSFTNLSADKMTPSCYQGVLSSLPNARELNVSIAIEYTSNNFEITTDTKRMKQIVYRQHDINTINVTLQQCVSQSLGEVNLGFKSRLLALLFGEQSRNQHLLYVSGDMGRYGKTLVDLFVKTIQLTYLNSPRDMSSLVQRCVTAQSMILKSPTIYTVVGLQNLPKQLQREVRTMRILDSVLTAEVTRRMWSCLKLFPSLNTINITDSSLRFPSSLPKLSSFTNLSADEMTPSCYQNVLSSLPNARDLNVSIAIEDTSNTFEITTDTKRMKQIVYRQHDINTINVTLQQCVSQSLGEVNLGFKSGGLALLFGEQSQNQHLLYVSGDMGRYGETLVDLFVKTTQLTYLNSPSLASTHLVGFIKRYKLSEETTTRLWSCLRSFNSLNHLYVSDSSLSFPSYSIELSSVTKLSAEKLTSRCYKGLISSLPGLVDIDITMDDAERDILQITAGLRETGGQRLERIILRRFPISLPSRNVITPGLLFEKHTDGMKIIKLDGSVEKYEEGCLEFLKSLAYLASLTYLQLEFLDGWSFNFKITFGIEITKCHLSSEMTARMWSCLRPFTSLNHLTISDSSLSFSLSPPELPSVTMLLANKLTSQCYQGLISSLPGLRDIDVQDVQAGYDFVEFVESSTSLTSLQRLEIKSLNKWQFDLDNSSGAKITNCRLSCVMTCRMWTCVRSFTSLNHLTISDSSLSFPPSPPELPSVTNLSAERVTSQCYEGLISSLPGLEDIGITMDDAEGDIARYTAVLRRTAWQKLKHIYLYGPQSLSPEKNRVSRETMRGVGQVIKEHTQNLQKLHLDRVGCTHEDDLVYLIDCCRHVKAMKYVGFFYCGTTRSGRLQSHLKQLHCGSSDSLNVYVFHDDDVYVRYFIPHTVD